MNKPKEHEYFRCSCYSPYHNFVVSHLDWRDVDDFDVDDTEHNEILISVRLHSHYSFWNRLWDGIGYIFGKDTASYCSVGLGKDETQRLIDVLEDRKEFLWKKNQ